MGKIPEIYMRQSSAESCEITSNEDLLISTPVHRLNVFLLLFIIVWG